MKQYLKYLFLLMFITSIAYAVGSKSLQGSDWKSADLTQTWTPPAATDVLVGRASIDTLTNKSIDGGSNTLTNIPLSAGSGVLPVAHGGTGAATTSQNYGFMGPTSGSGAPSFRALVAADFSAATLLGDITGPLGTTNVAQIQGTTVSGTTGTGNVVFSASPTLTGTATTSDILAATDNTYNIGSVTQRFASEFLDSALNIGTYPTAGGQGLMRLTAGSFPQIEFYAGGSFANALLYDGTKMYFQDMGSATTGMTTTPGHHQFNDSSGVAMLTVDGTTGVTSAKNVTISPFSTAGVVLNNGSGTLSSSAGPLAVANGGTNNGSLAMTAGGTFYSDGTKIINVGAGTSGYLLQSNGASAPTWVTPPSTGVTSVAATTPGFLSVSGSPVTGSGTLAFSYSGTALPVANGGTGLTTNTAYGVIVGGTTTGGILQSITPGTSGYLLQSNGASSLPTWVTPPAAGVTSVAMTVPSFLSVSGSPITTSGTLGVTLSGTALPIANGGTGATSSSAAFNALSPLTTQGDVLFGGASGAGTRLAAGTANQVLQFQGSSTSPSWQTIKQANQTNYVNANPDAEVDTTGWAAVSSQDTGTFSSNSGLAFTSTGSAHNWYIGMPLIFETSNTMPTGLTAGTTYYVSALNGANQMLVSATVGGSSVAYTNAGSGTMTMYPLVPIYDSNTGTSLSGLTFSRSTSSPLHGAGSFSLAQTNSTVVAGQGVAYAFTIDAADKAKSLTVSFDYNASSTFVASSGQVGSASDLQMYLYDVTNTNWIPISSNLITANGSNNFTYSGTFQTASNSTSYRLLVWAATNSANGTGWTFKYDNVAVSRQISPTGAPITDWVAYTPTITGFGTPTSVNFYSRRVGGNLEVSGTFTSGTTTAVTSQISIGFNGSNNNVSVDTTKTSTVAVLGDSAGGQNTSTYFGQEIVYFSTTTVAIGVQTSTTQATTPALGNAVANAGNAIAVNFKVPIVGWSSNVSMSNDTDTRVVAAKYTGATATLTSSYSNVTFTTLVNDTHAGYSGATYTVPVSGFYDFSGQVYVAGTASLNGTTIVGLSKNASVVFENDYTYAGAVTGSVGIPFFFGSVYCTAGDAIIIQAKSANTLPVITASATENFLQIKRLSGPATIATSESVNASYTTANVTITNGNSNVTKIPFTAIIKDTHNAYNTSTGVYTVPVAGTYMVNVNTCVVPVSGNWTIAIFYNNTISSYGTVISSSATSCQAVTFALLKCNAGDTIDVRGNQNSGSGNSAFGLSSAYRDQLTIERVGN